ncbi:hypothetical protein GCM10009841_18110 [Microlunatus panaciterrae]|uniref:Uncharacterized protein n=1 Tax=Microlunatus panaciterrae TaxID=400768 RepID=A0ABS2RN11_9ACTN|nr:hypothetical protein [Microlunatus panaciterrae]MBM7800370.1 hypothetical protein [Microlunatus panaciterrae]
MNQDRFSGDPDDSDEDWEPEFSARSAAAVRLAAQDVIEAFKHHVDVVCAATSPAAEDSIDTSAEVLREALHRFTERQSDHCGEWTPFYDAFEPEDDEEDELDDLLEQLIDGDDGLGPVTGISRLARWDFEVVDEDAVIAAGKAAWREEYPDTTEDDLASHNHNVGLAIYNITHVRGQEALLETEGLEPTWGYIATYQQQELGPLETDDGSDEVFAMERPPLFSEEYVFSEDEPS